MSRSIAAGRGHRIAEDNLLFREGQIRRDQHATAFVSVGQQSKEHFHILPSLLHVTKVIDIGTPTAPLWRVRDTTG